MEETHADNVLAFPLVVHTYALSLSEDKKHLAAGAVATAAAVLSSRHPDDFLRFYPGMEFLSRFVFCNHAEMPLSDYLEVLYCTVKHGDFTRPWRANLRQVVQAPAAAVQ